jgi:hypothetical protein
VETDDFPSLRQRDGETARAYQGFLDYVGMGARRSLRELQAHYAQQTTSKPPASCVETLYGWSVQHEWQKRLGAYLEAVGQRQAQQRQERLQAFEEQVWDSFERLLKQLDGMIGEFHSLRITNQRHVPDPDSPDPDHPQMIRVITMKANVRDQQTLIAARGQLLKDTREALGLPKQVDVTSSAPIVFHILGDPSIWTSEPTPDGGP